ncbi:MAG TPA: hypothetical protein VNG90_00405 [Candidatus Acidoferrum sp.]|nr:hypothetical protein [Candidatus Acidoferrum sp.]
MKAIKKSKPIKKIVIITAIAAGAVAVGFACWLAYRHYYQNNSAATNTTTPPTTQTINYGPATQQEKQESTDQKQQVINENASQGSTPSSLPTSESLGVTISRTKQSAGELSIFTVVSGTTTGTCDVTLSKSGQPTVAHSFSITISATYATCDQVNIPVSEFSTSGDWQLSIAVKTASAESKPTPTTITINK